MSNGSKEQELPPLDERTEQDLRMGDSGPAYGQRTIQLSVAIAQIANLSAQVEDLQSLNSKLSAASEANIQIANENFHRAEKAEDELATGNKLCANLTDRVNDLQDELSALREGARVTYRVDYSSNKPKDSRISGTEQHARWLYKQPHAGMIPVRLTEIITRERIIDADGGKG